MDESFTSDNGQLSKPFEDASSVDSNHEVHEIDFVHDEMKKSNMG